MLNGKVFLQVKKILKEDEPICFIQIHREDPTHLPNYKAKISQPMCLRWIWEKITEYKSFDAFIHDFNLMYVINMILTLNLNNFF